MLHVACCAVSAVGRTVATLHVFCVPWSVALLHVVGCNVFSSLVFCQLHVVRCGVARCLLHHSEFRVVCFLLSVAALVVPCRLSPVVCYMFHVVYCPSHVVRCPLSVRRALFQDVRCPATCCRLHAPRAWCRLHVASRPLCFRCPLSAATLPAARLSVATLSVATLQVATLQVATLRVHRRWCPTVPFRLSAGPRLHFVALLNRSSAARCAINSSNKAINNRYKCLRCAASGREPINRIARAGRHCAWALPGAGVDLRPRRLDAAERRRGQARPACALPGVLRHCLSSPDRSGTGTAAPLPHPRRECDHPRHICTGTHDWASPAATPCDICTGTERVCHALPCSQLLRATPRPTT
jgi:hypothetical protein